MHASYEVQCKSGWSCCADVEDYLKALSEGTDVAVEGEAGKADLKSGARIVATGAPAEIVVPTWDPWQPDAEKSKKAAFGR